MIEHASTDATNDSTEGTQQTVRTGHPGTDQFLDAISRVRPFCATERLQPTS